MGNGGAGRPATSEPSKPPEPFRVFSCAANAAFRVRRGEEARRAGDGGLAPPDEVEARRQARQRQADASRLFDTPTFVFRASAPPTPVNPVIPVDPVSFSQVASKRMRPRALIYEYTHLCV